LRRVDFAMILEAPAELVWEVITDLDAYPEWNRFTPRISLATRELAVGAELDLECWITEKKLLPCEREVVLALEPERFAFCMGTSRRRGRPGIRSQRWQTCEPLPGGCTRFTNQESFEGPLSPLVYFLYGPKLRRAFRRYGEDLRRRVEELGRQREGAGASRG
jgi:hypothetical protein